MRHIATQYLWLQERIVQKDIDLETVTTAKNRGDAITKPLGGPRLMMLMQAVGLKFIDMVTSVSSLWLLM